MIENINERFKRFRMMQHTLPSALFPLADVIVFVCAYLSSFMGPVRLRTGPAAVGVSLASASHRPDEHTPMDVSAPPAQPGDSDSEDSGEDVANLLIPTHLQEYDDALATAAATGVDPAEECERLLLHLSCEDEC